MDNAQIPGIRFQKIKMKHCFLLLFTLISFLTNAQEVEETIQLDTIIETYRVVYRPIVKTTYYYKKIAVFANDTSQVAIEKTFSNGHQNGVYKVYYPSGRLKVFTVYANDSINGEWTWYDTKGIILVKGVYVNGTKHGYWAYKSLKTYGRYKKGKKNGKWYKKDVNDKKIKSYYKNGKLVKGEGFGNEGIIYSDTTYEKNDTLMVESTQANNQNQQLASEYVQAVSFLKENVVFRKTLKEYYGQGDLKKIREIKKYYKQNKFQFGISPAILSLNAGLFVKESKEGKIVVQVIDSILKSNSGVIAPSVTDKVIREDRALFNQSTSPGCEMVVFFSEITGHLLKITLVKYNEVLEDNYSFDRFRQIPDAQKFQILLYFDDAGILKGAEYQKP